MYVRFVVINGNDRNNQQLSCYSSNEAVLFLILTSYMKLSVITGCCLYLSRFVYYISQQMEEVTC